MCILRPAFPMDGVCSACLFDVVRCSCSRTHQSHNNAVSASSSSGHVGLVRDRVSLFERGVADDSGQGGAAASSAPARPRRTLTLTGLDAPGAGAMLAAAAAAADAISGVRDVGDGGADADIGTTPP